MDRMSLLKALAESRGFKRSLQDVALDKCVVTVCASANKKRPSEEEMAKAVPLEGGETLGELASGMAAAGSNLFIRMTPGSTTATKAGVAAQRESRALIPVPGLHGCCCRLLHPSIRSVRRYSYACTAWHVDMSWRGVGSGTRPPRT